MSKDERTSDQYGFLGERSGSEITIADSMGGGRQFDADDDRDTLIDEIGDYIVDCSRSIAEALVDDLVDDSDEDGES